MILGLPTPHNYFAPWQTCTALLGVASKYPVYTIEGPYIYMNRNVLIDRARKLNESLLMVDADMVFKKEDVEKMEAHLDNCDVVTGLYCDTKPPYMEWIFDRVEGDYMTYQRLGKEIPKELSLIGACGGGFLAISKEVIQKLPFECCNNIKEGEIEHGEDISLCHRIAELGYEIWVDPTIRLGQVRSQAVYPQ